MLMHPATMGSTIPRQICLNCISKVIKYEPGSKAVNGGPLQFFSSGCCLG